MTKLQRKSAEIAAISPWKNLLNIGAKYTYSLEMLIALAVLLSVKLLLSITRSWIFLLIPIVVASTERSENSHINCTHKATPTIFKPLKNCSKRSSTIIIMLTKLLFVHLSLFCSYDIPNIVSAHETICHPFF